MIDYDYIHERWQVDQFKSLTNQLLGIFLVL